MKKTTQKFTLNREAIRVLKSTSLAGVAGGLDGGPPDTDTIFVTRIQAVAAR